jgi:HlyD family secretion protein
VKNKPMGTDSSDTEAKLAKVVAAAPRAGGLRKGLRWLLAALAPALVLGAWLSFRSGPEPGGRPTFQTEPVTRGSLRVAVSATGTLEPINQVDVGIEQSGTVATVFVDYNDRVAKGQVLARLDVTKLENQVAKAKASLASAEAKVLQAKATVKEARASLSRLREVARLSGGKVPAPTELETAEAELARAEADEADTRAAVDEARATLRSNETDLAKASIYSPIDGVVLARSIEPGQTVAASLEAPVLFTLAESLAQMELQVDVDEADVGQVRAGQSATFTVDAYPNRRFPARIRLVRFGSETADNVVTYKTILNVDNQDLSLRPGMTATAEIVTAQLEDVLLVSNAALRFSPPAPDAAPPSPGLIASLLPRPPRMARRRPADQSLSGDGERRLWILRNGEAAPLPVSVGLSDGRLTEVRGEGLEPDLPVITAAGTTATP